MKKFLIVCASICALASCTSLKEEFQPVFTTKYDNPVPEKFYTDADFKNMVTVKDLSGYYKQGNPFEMPGKTNVGLAGAVLKGRVTTTDRPGNFYKSLYIQDETGGIEIKIGKNGLYNDYLQGQTLYIKLSGLWLGMYGYKDGKYGGQGMVQIGYDGSGSEYETSYLEIPRLIQTHILKGDPSDIELPAPLVITDESQLPDPKKVHQAHNDKVGKYVTLCGLKYDNESFCLLYLDSKKDKKSYTNRVFLSSTNGSTPTNGITTLAMSKDKMIKYLYSGAWNACKVGSGNTFLKDDNGKEVTLGDLKGEDGTYPTVEKAAYSVSQYFTMGGTQVQIRTSGFCRFADYEIPEDVLSGERAVDVTGVLTNYQGALQFIVNSADDFVYSDSKKPIYN